MNQTNDAAIFVAEYKTREMLARLGYRFSVDELTDIEVDAFMLIEQEFAKADKRRKK